MRVWIVNPFDNLPCEGFRPQRFTLMARAFAAAGCETAYWTADFSHALKKPRTLQPAGEPFELIPVHESAYSKNISLRRAWAHWRWAKNWRKAAENTPKRPDLVIVSSPPVLIGREVRHFCASRAIPYIVDVMDAWPETFYRLAPQWLFAPVRRVVAENYRRAAAISVVARVYTSLLGDSYGLTAQYFPHGIEPPPENRPSAPSGLVYIGNMSASYDLQTVMEAMRQLPDVQLKIAGSGPDEAKLRRSAPRNVQFLGYLGESALHSLLFSSAIGLVPMFQASCVGIPYKFGDYIAHSLAVVSSLEGETRELLETSGAGLYYPAGDAAALAKAIRTALSRQDAMRRAAATLFPAFDASQIYPRYAAWARGIVKS